MNIIERAQHQSPRNAFLSTFSNHPVAANLLMVLMVLAGIWGLWQLNTQFFPNFDLEQISVRIVWPGATAEDVEANITTPLEQELRSLDFLRKMTSTSAEGIAAISLEYEEGTDMTQALEQVQQRVDSLRNLPTDSEKPTISRLVRYDPVAKLLVSGANLEELRPLVRDFETSLLRAGVAKITIIGLPKEEIAIEISAEDLVRLNQPLSALATTISRASQNIPAGTIGSAENSKQLRALEEQRTVEGFATIALQNAQGQSANLYLGEIAQIERRLQEGQVRLFYQGQPAVELSIQRTENADTLAAAKILQRWLSETAPTLPPNIRFHVYEEQWKYIDQRIQLLLKNGLSGLLLVLLFLYIFLDSRVAFWVAVGVPVSFLLTLAIIYLFGGSINMISLFGLIMSLGIIVDDAIVVGEDTLARREAGADSVTAAEGGAARMFAPVMASSLTTVAAFLPLMLIGGTIGKILFELPFTVICVILASLFECFFILPGHLREHLTKPSHLRGFERSFRLWFEKSFGYVRDHLFKNSVAAAVRHSGITISLTAGIFILSIALLASGRIGFTFFPTPEGNTLYANVVFHSGTPEEKVLDFLKESERALARAQEKLGENIVSTQVLRLGSSSLAGGQGQTGDNFGSIVVELIDADLRKTRNPTLIKAWRAEIQLPPGIENFSIIAQRGGPPGSDIQVQLVGNNARDLKEAALILQNSLNGLPGVSGIEDDLPYGQEQWIYRLNARGQALGLNIESIGRQVRAAYEGQRVQIFQDQSDEIEVRLSLPRAERERLFGFSQLPIFLPSGESLPLADVVTIESQRGFDILRHRDGELAIEVSASVDASVNSANRLLADLQRELLPQLARDYGLRYRLEGRSADQAETFADMRIGLILALALIYIILAWVFGSYTRPLAVMAIIPFGLIGVILGHWLIGINLTLLSFFGVFALIGISVNGSIVLVSFYHELLEQGMDRYTAMVEAVRLRFRALLLTSLTTIGGLLPLLFETSVQAQFLIPMAVSLSFGLMATTLLVLYFIPALLYQIEKGRENPKLAAKLAA
jgi:multidrug efflux pump subunit AcrB